MKNQKTFFVSYYADETLPVNKCHTGLKRLSKRKRSKFFPLTEQGKKEGLKFFKECKYPITQEKSLLFLKGREEGLRIMNDINRMEEIEAICSEPITLDLNKSNVEPLSF